MTFRSFDILKLVEDFGQALVLRKTTTEGTYDPALGVVTGAVTTDFNFKGYFSNFTNSIPNNEEVRRGTRRCIIPALGFAVEPDDEDLVLGQGDAVAIVRVSTVYSSGTAVCYICEVQE